MFDSIARMAEETVRVFDGRVRGIWLYGSVVLDDFRPGWSDIDWLVLTDGPIPEDRAREMLTLRQTLALRHPDNPYFRLFEGIAADADEYRAGSFTRLVYWGTSGQRITDRYVPDAFSRFELARYGRSVYGEADRSVFEEPSFEELRGAVRRHYESVRLYAAETDESLYSCGWLLDIARCIYTLRTHDILSKTRAGVRALEEHVFPDEEPLRRALEIRRDPPMYKDRQDVKRWLKGLGPTVQRYADVLERELILCSH